MINNARETIDKLDKEIVKLFEQRMNAVAIIAQYKKMQGIAICDVNREDDIIKKAKQQLKNPSYGPYLVQFFKGLMEISREYQNNLIQK